MYSVPLFELPVLSKLESPMYAWLLFFKRCLGWSYQLDKTLSSGQVHLLLFITRKYPIICVKQRPIAQRNIHVHNKMRPYALLSILAYLYIESKERPIDCTSALTSVLSTLRPSRNAIELQTVSKMIIGNLSTRRSWFTNGMAGRAELDRGRSLRAKCKSLSKPTWNHHEHEQNNYLGVAPNIVMHLSMLSRRGGGGRAWGADLTDLVIPGEGIFDCRLGRKRLRPNICSRFHASRMRARSGKSWRPLTRVSVDFTVLSSNFVCFGVFLINWTS